MKNRLRIGVITKYTDGIYHGNLINGINCCIKEMNAKLFVINTFMISRFFTDIKKVERYYNLAFNHIDGWLILAEGTNDSYLNKIVGNDKPVVFIGTGNEAEKSTIAQNVYELGYTAATTLINKIKSGEKSEKTIFTESKIIMKKSCNCNFDSNNIGDLSNENGRKKDIIIKYLEETILKNTDIGAKLLTADIDGIKKLFPYIIDGYSWECIGFWNDEKYEEDNLIIKDLYEMAKKHESINISCKPQEFPPLEVLEDKNYMDNDEIIWILPISSTTRNWGVMAYSCPFNEISALVKNNISTVMTTLLGIAMERDVAQTDLEVSLETLKQAQEKLIYSEKMAALGGLVAGVAHEVNTPVGVSITAASFLDDKDNEIINLFDSGKLKRVDLEDYINTALETIEILNLNLDRALKLVKSFKQISSNESTTEKKRFFLKKHIDEVLMSLNPKIRLTGHSIIVNCDSDLEVCASPVSLSQIIINLVMNSLLHGFENIKQGKIEINVYKENDEIVIEYSDNGKGINKNDIKKIYEPFFTTKRGKGGTGLGLNLVYNIVTKEYKGNIKCKSTIGNGTTFIIRIPVSIC
ncbi:MAG TPA: sensor histidine kinase [Pseudobacteroides sp.]|nr:sensor histidine kinase [Pseudobacteroides sp.]